MLVLIFYKKKKKKKKKKKIKIWSAETLLSMQSVNIGWMWALGLFSG